MTDNLFRISGDWALGADEVQWIICQPVERSLRRALRGLIGDGKMGAVIALGEGGPADPHRYAYNPIWAALAGNEEGYQRLCAIAQAGRSSIAAR